MSDINDIISKIEKQYGKGSIMQLKSQEYPVIERIPTGCLSLDNILEGGIPKGRVTEVYGTESSGKTTLALHIIAEAQKSNQTVAYIDAEHALDITWAEKIGVNINNLLLSQPDTGEQALDIVEILTESQAVNLIIVDSVAALTPKAEIEGEMGDSHMGLQARLMSQAMRKLTSITHKYNVAVIFINQIRMKIGVLYGNPETTTGGKALKFYSSVRLELRRISTIKESSGQNVGSKIRAKIVKSKVSPPFQQTEFSIMFDSGIDYFGNLIELAVTKNIIEKKGAWFNYKEIKLGQGLENAKKLLKDNEDLTNEIKNKL